MVDTIFTQIQNENVSLIQHMKNKQWPYNHIQGYSK